MTDRASITERLLAGERPALARLISWAENGDDRFPAALEAIFGRTGRAARTGVTGPPGAGKSTLVNELVRHLRLRDRQVGVLAVDPSSPLTGGALLGDRIRMEDRTLDPGVFIRSMASRGSHGGVARACVDALDVMDAFGFDELLVETVGVGQAEYDVVGTADTVVVVLCPGAGDGVQAMKSGLLELADVLVVNKADLPGAERLAHDLEEAVHIRTAGRDLWAPPVVSASAGKDEGLEGVLDAIEAHRAHVAPRLEALRTGRRQAQVRRVVGERLDEHLWEAGDVPARVQDLLAGGATPYDVAARLMAALRESLQDVARHANLAGDPASGPSPAGTPAPELHP